MPSDKGVRVSSEECGVVITAKNPKNGDCLLVLNPEIPDLIEQLRAHCANGFEKRKQELWRRIEIASQTIKEAHQELEALEREKAAGARGSA